MKTIFLGRRCIALAAVLMMALAVPIFGNTGNQSRTSGTAVTILFSHDMHSHAEKFPQIRTLYVEREQAGKAPLLIDAGDFSMGTPYQTIFTQTASELRMMGAVGYEVVTLGNHEFDYRSQGLSAMLEAAMASGDPLPQMVISNIDWEGTLADSSLKENGQRLKENLEKYGAQEYTLVERQGMTIAIFGIFGEESASYAPESGTLFLDSVSQAQKTVDRIREEADPDVIICLSHSGTHDENPDQSWDEILGKEVKGIDVIVSGHSHSYLQEPLRVGDTTVVSCGQYNDYLGELTLQVTDGAVSVSGYQLLPLDDTVPADPEILALTQTYREQVDALFFQPEGFTWDGVLTQNSIAFTPIDTFGDVQGADSLGNLIADSYVYAVEQAEGDAYETVDVAVAPAGVIRGSFDQGPITAADAYNALSLGSGKDGKPGYPLVSVYLTGEELKLIAEIDISVSPLMGPARLYNSGLVYAYNPHRTLLNKTYDVRLDRGDGGYEELVPDRLYRVVTDLYTAQMLSTVNDISYGLLSLVPKDKEGEPVVNPEDQIIYRPDGTELKEWYGLASYLASFPDGQVPDRYATGENRKVEVNSWNPIQLVKQPNKFFFIIWGILLSLLLVIVLLVRWIRRRIRRRRLRRAG